ncbi:MAG: hypothetical protein ACPG7F_04135, partial [Aggregatilineales bacterium]
MMRKLFSFIVGLGIGISAGVLLVTLFSPVSGQELQRNLKSHYKESMTEASKAATQKRLELEAELAAKYNL